MSTKQSPLLTIPCEIRLEIYAYALTSNTSCLVIKPAIKPTKTNKWWQRPYRDYTAPGLLFTNRQIRSEALGAYHKYLLNHLVDLQSTVDSIDNAVNKFKLCPKEQTLLRCERDSVEKEIRLVEKEMGEQQVAKAAEQQQAEQSME